MEEDEKLMQRIADENRKMEEEVEREKTKERGKLEQVRCGAATTTRRPTRSIQAASCGPPFGDCRIAQRISPFWTRLYQPF